MKLSRIRIRDMYRFKDLDINLTYPEGHPKHGKPLDKVCIIGESGTGKTTLLELIMAMTPSNLNIRGTYQNDIDDTAFRTENGSVEFNYRWNDLDFYSGKNKKSAFTLRYNPLPDGDTDTDSINPSLLYFPQSFQTLFQYINSDAFRTDFNIESVSELNKRFSEGQLYIPRKMKESGAQLSPYFILTLNEAVACGMRRLLFNDQAIYNRARAEHVLKIGDASIENAQNLPSLIQEYENWQKHYPNPSEFIKTLLDPILAPFNLEINLRYSHNSPYFLHLKHLSGSEIPEEGLSTGTRQILSALLPLVAMRPQNALILLDEPENSLYPSMQARFVDFFCNSSLTTDCQFFFATHSPFILSNFEPWEIIELKFVDGWVVQDKNYEGDGRSIADYKFDPRLLTWNSILNQIFDLEHDSNPARAEKIREMHGLYADFKKLQAEGKKAEADAIYEKYEQVGNSLLYWANK